MEANRKTGSVKWFSRVKGYGFITPDGEAKEIFVHFSGIEGEGYRNLEEGQRVSFAVEDTPKGPQAVAVRAMDAGPAAERPAVSGAGELDEEEPDPAA